MRSLLSHHQNRCVSQVEFSGQEWHYKVLRTYSQHSKSCGVAAVFCDGPFQLFPEVQVHVGPLPHLKKNHIRCLEAFGALFKRKIEN